MPSFSRPQQLGLLILLFLVALLALSRSFALP